MALQKVLGIAHVPPDVRLGDAPYQVLEDHPYQQEHAHYREGEDVSRESETKTCGCSS